MAKKKNNEELLKNAEIINEELSILPEQFDENIDDSELLDDENIESLKLPNQIENNQNNTQMPYINTPDKCVILCMCCNDEYYLKEFEDIKQTWGERIIKGYYPHVDIWGYKGSLTGKYEIDEEARMISVPCLDDLNNTYKKTELAINALQMFGIEYDWILRTNCSTIINANMIDAMMEINYLDKNKIYVSHLDLNIEKSIPYAYSPISRGQFLLFSKKYALLINESCLEITKYLCDRNRILNYDLFNVDDITICAIFNTYLELQHINVLDTYVILPTHYMAKLYEGEQMFSCAVAIFNKWYEDRRPIQNYYYDMHDRYMQFFTNFYDNLSDNINDMETIMPQYRYLTICKINEKLESSYYKIPFELYLSDEMMQIL